MRLLALVVLFCSAVVHASVPPAFLFISSQAPDTEDDEDEGESEAPAAPGAVTPGTASPADAPAAGEASGDAAAEGPGAAAAEIRDEQAQRLVSGAPLYNPNVAVHIVEKKAIADKGKREVILFPVAPQVNGKFTQHHGTAAGFVWHVHENFGLQLMGQYNWYVSESEYSNELIQRAQRRAETATALLLRWGALGGVEVTPIYGKFAFYESSLAHFSIVLNGGLGVGSTLAQLKEKNAAGPAVFGETGERFMASVGGGFRLQFGEKFTLRLELRDFVYAARVDRVNGCDRADLASMRAATSTQNPELTGANVSPSCRIERFRGQGNSHISLAQGLVEGKDGTPSSDVLNNVSLYLGLAVLF